MYITVVAGSYIIYMHIDYWTDKVLLIFTNCVLDS